jgi:hypothetical protein
MVSGDSLPLDGQPAPRKFAAPYERSFPLVALLQLATCCAALAMCVDGPRLRQVLDQAGNIKVWQWQEWTSLGVALFSGAALGFLMGLAQLRMWRSAAMGASVGGLCGFALLTVYVAPAPIERIAAGAGMVLLTTIAFRLRSA